MALLWRCVTFGVCRDDVAGRQRLARREPLALGVVQAASGTGDELQEAGRLMNDAGFGSQSL